VNLKARVITAETEDIIGQYIIFGHVMDDQYKSMGGAGKLRRKRSGSAGT
jgi:hypothetical protein